MNIAHTDVAYEVSINPATLEEIGRLPMTTPEGFTEAFEQARQAQNHVCLVAWVPLQGP